MHLNCGPRRLTSIEGQDFKTAIAMTKTSNIVRNVLSFRKLGKTLYARSIPNDKPRTYTFITMLNTETYPETEIKNCHYNVSEFFEYFFLHDESCDILRIKTIS